MSPPQCRLCSAPLHHTFLDLGMSPLSNAFLRADQLGEEEAFFPLHARVCDRCFLVQLEQFESPEKIFREYAYFSSYSQSWLRHAQAYVECILERIELGQTSLVVEIASNDGYLLQYFRARGIPVLGVEPARNVAEAAAQKGIDTLATFFGTQTARELAGAGRQADLLVANNVLAHVPDLRDFVSGLKSLLKPRGLLTVEFPHLSRMIEGNQFDTIYHEHFSYFSFCTAETLFHQHGLTVFDVEELPTHGGSLRLYVCHAEETHQRPHPRVFELRTREIANGMRDLGTYSRFEQKALAAKRSILDFLVGAKREGKSVVGYGAPAKGNTLLNYCGIGRSLLDYTVDINPHKQHHFLPGTHIPIYHPDMIRRTQPDYVLILPWNLRDEIMAQLAEVRRWDGRFVIPIPTTEVIK
jgi:SAM-dependent methyltransferase